MITVAEAMVACLEHEGITTIFGIPGATICPFYDALYDSNITHILTRHEQSAGHSANGYARVTGKPAVCVATSGPGALNLITAIATAYMDSIPLVVITGQVSSEQLGRDVFQEADITGSAEPFVKHSYLIKSALEVQSVIKNAFHIASTGRQGPVIIDIPVDIQQELVSFNYPETTSIRSYNPNTHGHMGQIKKLIAAINSANTPLLCVGGGIFSANAEDALLQLVNKCKIPVVSTMMGIGAISPCHELYLGMVGMYGDNNANRAVNTADLLILVGARVGDRAIMSPIGLSQNTTIAHLDIDPAEIGKNIITDIPIVGDADDILMELYTRLAKMDKSGLTVSFKKQLFETTIEFNETTILQAVMKACSYDAIVVADVGQNQLYAAKNYKIKNGRFLTSGGMGTMGYALPAAIGASLACKDRLVLCICGDGGFQMSMMELATIAENNVNVKILVLNNNSLGLVKELQQKKYNGREIAVEFTKNPSFKEIASAYGIKAKTITSMRGIDKVITEFLDGERPYLLEVLV